MTYDFPDHIKGDTFEGVQFTVTVNSVALDLTGATIKMQVRKSPTSAVIDTYTTTGGHLTITNAAGGIFTFDEQIISLASAKYYYDIQITLADATVKTYISGYWTITQDITT